MEIKGERYLWRPPLIKAPLASWDKNKYYRFHQDHDHDIKNCFILKNEIEDLIHGYLGKYVEKEGTQPNEQISDL